MGPELVDRTVGYGDRIAICALDGSFTYRRLFDDSARAASALTDGRVAFMVHPSYRYVVTMLGTWRAGGMAVPIGTALPDPEIEYVLDDASPAVAVADDAFAARLEPLAHARGVPFVHVDTLLAADAGALPDVAGDDASMMLYTSGTTGRPKGVVHTHTSIAAQIRGMVEAWQWTADDHILLVLPLHHVHGIVNVLCCALWSGATCDIHASFDADATWQHIRGGELTLFMAVPTIYSRLIDAYERAAPADQAAMTRAAQGMRLMVSGSAALPVPTLEHWRRLTGHTLLERYGMTEIGMALSNALEDRRPGHVGVPMPGVEVKLRDDGEMLVRGANVFREYWQRPDATRDVFTDGWFRTGDVVSIDDGSYRILGRASVDIIKTGAEKVSALEIEDVLREHPAVVDCAVVGVPDDNWGERVCAAVVAVAGREPEVDGLRDWAKQQLAAYKVPRQFVAVADLPRNALGKVTKPQLRELFMSDIAIRLRAEATIAAPAVELYALVTDLERMGEWSTENLGAKWIEGEPGVVGSRFLGRNRDGPVEWEGAGEVIVAEPGREFVFAIGPDPSDPHGTWRYVFEDVGGPTRVIETYELGPGASGFRAMIDALPADARPAAIERRSSTLRAGMEATVTRLKAYAEDWTPRPQPRADDEWS